MKNLTILFLFYTIISFSQNEIARFHSNGKIKKYHNFDSGMMVELYDNGQRKTAGFYDTKYHMVNGSVTPKKIGEWVYFNKQGDLLKVMRYNCKNNTDKTIIFNDSCRIKTMNWVEYYFNKKDIRQKGTIKNYMKEGKWEKYYQNGKLRKVINYKNDVRQGESSYYYENGNVYCKTFYVNGKQVGEYFEYDMHTKKQTVKTYMLNGKFNGTFLENYANGNKYREGYFIKGDKNGGWKYYHKNGTLKMEGIYLYNERHGLWKRFSETGRLMGTINFKNGNRDGKAIFYDKNGKIKEEKIYKNGVQVK